jgi:hypothetical protein
MSFQDFQRQIEVVSDPAVLDEWKEQARSVTTYATKNQEPAETFNSVAEAERHFRQTHLPTLLRSANEMTITGVVSRRLQDRGLGRVIEDAWSAEVRSPSKMMAELAGALRPAGLNIFRHRRGMLFVSPIRIRMFGHERTSVSGSINAILEKLTETPGLNRKLLAEKMVAGLEAADADRVKLGLASDLRWLISEGYVIEFNDGTLDLPRAKPAPAAPGEKAGAQPQATAAAADSVAAPSTDAPYSEVASIEPVAATPLEAEGVWPAEGDALEVGENGMSVEQSVEPMPAPAEPEPANEGQPEQQPEAAIPPQARADDPRHAAEQRQAGPPEEPVPSPS